LQNLGSTQLTSIQKSQSQSKSCGLNILSILVSHTAEIFERNKRGMIPRGETLLNKKAKAKLEVACEDALRSFGYSPKAHVTIDGLIDGIDCQVEIMLARFEMLLASVLKTAEGMIRDFIASLGVEFDGILCSGGIMRMKCVDSMMKRLFEGKWKGKGVGDVAPEEAVALGCAKYAQTILEFSLREGLYDTKENDGSTNHEHVIEKDVVLSPIGIGLSLQENDPAAIIMIEDRTPLPALVTKNIPLAGCSSYLGVKQISKEGGAEKIIGKIEGIDMSASSVEVTMELSCKGQLSVVVNGGSKFVL
jgi:molecular chaperone DnaK (HSP70)